jgi:hypothetical protein
VAWNWSTATVPTSRRKIAILAAGEGSRRGALSVNPGTRWQAVGIGDFNPNGDSDILFENASSGQVAIWEMCRTSPARRQSSARRQPAAELGCDWDLSPLATAPPQRAGIH